MSATNNFNIAQDSSVAFFSETQSQSNRTTVKGHAECEKWQIAAAETKRRSENSNSNNDETGQEEQSQRQRQSRSRRQVDKEKDSYE